MMKRILSAWILILLMAGSVAAQEKEFAFQERLGEQVWITIGEDAYPVMKQILEESGFREPMPVLAKRNGVVVTRIKEEMTALISKEMHHRFNRCGGFLAHVDYQDAMASLNNDKIGKAMKASLVSYSIDNGAVANTMINDLVESNIVSTISSLSSYTSRYYTTQGGLDSANGLKAPWETLAAGRSDITVELYGHSWLQPSVIATITGQTLPSEVVVIGGHLDSTSSSSSAPGADDDASGIATVTEAFRVAMANDYKPDRTIKFMAYAAEEVGLRGSGDIASDFAGSGVNVVGVMQLDMTNYNGSSPDIVLMQDYTNAAQNTFLTQLIDTYVGVSWAYDNCGYGCSDHASWTNNGFVASMPFESYMGQYNPNIHTSGDTLAFLGNNAIHAMKFAKLAVSYMAELAKGDFTGSGGNNAPSAAFTSSANLLAVSFDGSGSSDSDGTISDYDWDFGDGNVGTGSTTSHTYASSGTYTVTLTVTDDLGATGSVNHDVTVNDGTSWVQISSTNFESGWGPYSQGGNDCRRSVNDSSYAHGGTYCVRIRDNSGTASSFSSSAGINLTGYSEMKVEFWFRANSMENNEDFFLEFWNGSAWQIAATWASGSEFSNGSFYNPTVILDSGTYNFTSGALLRFRCDASGNNDQVYIDDIVVSAR